jgi:hypothetical protein
VSHLGSGAQLRQYSLEDRLLGDHKTVQIVTISGRSQTAPPE